MNQSLKVIILNFFRNIFKIRFLESSLASLTVGKSTHHFICKFVPNPYQYPSGSFRILQRNGIIMEVDISDYIGHYLFFGFADPGMEKLFSLCRENSNVLDVGTNIGWTVLNLSAIATKGRVIGFEPDAHNFERCSKNIALNNFANIEVFRVGLGNKNLRMDMEVRTPFNRGGNRIAPIGKSSQQTVEIVRLDDFKSVTDLPSIDLIKIDVEGFELNVLRGASDLLKKYKPVLFIELDDNNLRDQGDSASELIKFLFDVGYNEIEHAESEARISDKTDFANCHFDIVVK